MSATAHTTPAFDLDDEDEEMYPSSDGRPFAEGDLHCHLMMDCIEGLGLYFSERPDVYVSGNNFIYYEEGNPKARVSPDCYVVFGADKRLRDSYKVWEEGGRLPDVVFEFTSRKTRHEDRAKKWPVYERALKVPEYFRFDPRGDYLEPRLQGSRLVNGRHVPMTLVDNRLHSQVLGLDLVYNGEEFRLFDPARGEFLFMPFLYLRHRAAERERARAAAGALPVLEAEITRLRAELEALRRGSAG